ncbi:ABC transporter substrate-binding protein [Cytobacillus sp. FJAT-54145]|uniref:ABC transporter substrate-binding protein n=1 Tax=Cytobacillus spartinae TaxID=3299023 RepID=A0ABW6KEM0_9BACI
MLVFSLILTGCGQGESKEEAAQTEEKSDTGSETNKEEATPASYTVEHAMGTTTIEGTPEKVVILTNEGTEALLSMGVKPVGAVSSWSPAEGSDFYAHIKDQMEGVTAVGQESSVNLEAIAALQPDLIIGNKLRQEEIYEQLNKIAPTVFAETLKGDWKLNFELYAKALNKEAEGQKVMADFDARVAEIKENAGDKLTTEISIIRFMADHVRIYLKDTFAGTILEQIGFARPEAQNVEDFMIKAGKEQIPQMEGDIIFYFTYAPPGETDALNNEEEWLKDPLFQNLEAVKAGNIHKVDDSIWNTAGGVIAANLFLDDLEKFFLEQ